MSELKTMQDLKEEFEKDVLEKANDGNFAVNSMLVGANLFYFDRGKEEAIKWVKFYRAQNHGAQIPELLGENPKAQALIDFCNITEEDLR